MKKNVTVRLSLYWDTAEVVISMGTIEKEIFNLTSVADGIAEVDDIAQVVAFLAGEHLDERQCTGGDRGKG